LAQLKTPVFGNISGTIGNIVFTDKGDSNIVYKKTIRPKFTSPKLELIRAKFKLLASIAIAINGSPQLKSMWPANKKIRRTRFNSIFQANYNLVRTVEDLGTPIMAPGFGFPLVNGVVATTATGVTLSCDAFGMDSGVDSNIEKFASATGIVVLRSPVNPADPAFIALSVKTGLASLDTDAPISLSMNFGADQLTAFQSYTDKKVFLVLITQTPDGTPVHRSVQISH
jgi:hypothetical protein